MKAQPVPVRSLKLSNHDTGQCLDRWLSSGWWKVAICGKPCVPKIQTRSTSDSRNGFALSQIMDCDGCHQQNKKKIMKYESLFTILEPYHCWEKEHNVSGSGGFLSNNSLRYVCCKKSKWSFLPEKIEYSPRHQLE